uniref:Uncharacterized protein n=1 Tax=Rousettus aegyptiacus TaxID=9407 RepID=A0A7J8ILG4_ROUAE|nr:hypothetical protein HJG63_010634 [Rousettus aegyptiacus]
MEWESMATLDLVNLANQLARTLDELPRIKIAKISSFSALANERPYTKQTPNFCCHCKEPGHWKGIAINVSILKALSLLTSPFKVLLIPGDGPLRSYRGFSQSFLLINLEKLLFKLVRKLFLLLSTLVLHSQCTTTEIMLGFDDNCRND